MYHVYSTGKIFTKIRIYGCGNIEAQFDSNSVFCWQVHLYDLSTGHDSVWHSGIVAYGREYFFTDRGLVSVMPVRSQKWE